MFRLHGLWCQHLLQQQTSDRKKAAALRQKKRPTNHHPRYRRCKNVFGISFHTSSSERFGF